MFTNRRGNTDTSEIQHLIDNKALSEEQTRFIDTVRKLSEVFGLDFEFYASEVDENGQRHGDAGYIDDSGKIHIDIFAGQEKSAFIARDSTLTSTLLHELTHFIHDWSSKAWKEMYNYVVARYSPYGSVQAALEAIRAREELEGRENLDDDFVRDEFMAQCCEALFEDEAGMRDFAAKYKNTAQKIVEWLENVLEKISGINIGHSESDIAAVISQWQDGIEELREKWLLALEEAANNKNASEGVLQSSAKTEGKEEARKSRGERDMSKSQLSDVQDNRSSRSGVTADMSESARFEKLSKSKIVVHDSVDYNNYNEQLTKLENISRKEDAEKVLIPFVTKSLRILNKEISTPALNFSFTFSKNNGLMESIEKQLRYGGDYESLAKAFINMDHILDSAVLIEVHSDKYKGTVRENEHLENVYVLLSAYKDGSRIVPVQLEIKKQNIKNANILYINVALTKIETDVLESKSNDKIMPNVNSLISVSKYSISNIFANVNTVDKHFLKYVPDRFLTEEQKEAKQLALREDEYRISKIPLKNDSKKEKSLSKQNKNTAEIDNKRSSRSKRDEKSGAAAEAEAKAREIAEKWGLSGKKTEALGRGLTNIFESVSGAEVDMEFVRQQAASLAAKTANGMISPDMPADISDKLSFLRSFGAVSLTEEQRNAAAKLAGTFKEYRSRISSAVKINEKGEALSTAWEKLSERLPELFPADTAESDMARVMLQNVSRMLADERAYRMEGDELTEARESLQREIYDAANQYIQYNRVTSGLTETKLKNVVPRPSVRAVLAEAALKTAKTDEERAALREYKLNLETVNGMEAERDREYSKLLSMLPKSGGILKSPKSTTENYFLILPFHPINFCQVYFKFR